MGAPSFSIVPAPDPAALIKQAQAAGAQFSPGDAGKIRVVWPPDVDPALKAQLLANKDAVKAEWLKSQQPGMGARIAGGIDSALGGIGRAVGKVPYAGKVANALLPKSTEELGGLGGLAAGGALAPETGGLSIALPILGAALGGAGGGALKGNALKGAETGGIIGATGKIGEGAFKLLGHIPAAARNKLDIARIGSWIERRLPNATKSVGADVKTLEGFDIGIRNKGLTSATGKAVGDLHETIKTRFGDPVLDVPSLRKGKGGGDSFLDTLGGLKAAPDVGTPVELTKFSDAVDQVRKLDDIANYGRNDTDARIKLAAREARDRGIGAKREIAAGLNKSQPGLGDQYLAANKDHAVASILQRIFSEKGMFQPDGKINIAKFQELTQERSTAGYRDELNSILGNKDATDFIRNVAHRGAAPVARDIKGQGLWGLIPRMFVHSTGMSAIGHVPTGSAPIFSKTVGATPHSIPPLPPELFSLLFGPAAARAAGVSEEPP